MTGGGSLDSGYSGSQPMDVDSGDGCSGSLQNTTVEKNGQANKRPFHASASPRDGKQIRTSTNGKVKTLINIFFL